VISGASVGVPIDINVVAGGTRVCILLFTIVVGVEAFVAAQGRVPNLAPDLTHSFVVAVATTTTPSTPTTKTLISMAVHVATTSSTASISSVRTDVLVLFLGLHSRLYSEQLRVEIIEHLGLRVSDECLNEQIVFKVKRGEDVTDNFFIVHALAYNHHVISEAFHQRVVCSTGGRLPLALVASLE
jgi:hypothetical protein